MAKDSDNRRQSRFTSFSLFFGSAVLTATFLLYAFPETAESQINGRVTAPKFEGSEPHITRARLPKAPIQAEMPAPPPIRYVTGLPEPLVATGPVAEQENKDLDATLKEFAASPAKTGKGGDFSDYSKPLLAFISAHPQSNWNAALYTDLGLDFYDDGYYSRAFTAFGEAWRLGRNATSPQAHLLIDRAVGELAKMHARVGHGKELEALLADIGNRPIGGPATVLLTSARGGLSAFKGNPGISYLCGPKALRTVLVKLKASKKQIAVADSAVSGPHGFSLEQLGELATKAGLKYRLIHREPGQPIPVPSIMNWNVHHYAAVTAKKGDRYAVRDMTFGSRGGATAITEKAMDAESSGYFLVPASVAAHYPHSGWRPVTLHSDEAKAAYGMGFAPAMWLGLAADCGAVGEGGSCGMPSYDSETQQISASPMTAARAAPTVAGLHLDDTPVGYQPQIGIVNKDTISYSAREDLQPAVFSWSNLSPNWSHKWQAYIEYNPTVAYAHPVTRVAGGGGGYYYLDVADEPAVGDLENETPDASRIVRTPPEGPGNATWVRNMPDGGQEVYGLDNGATTNPARTFLTQIIDNKGNTTTINYDSTFRITSVVDAMGRSTTFTYGLSSYPLLITQITDPFGRTAQVTYDTSQRLASITDPAGITSSFTYSPSETTFVNTLTTPYGTSTFSDAVNPNDFPNPGGTSLSLTMTDPLGYTDYTYFYQPDTSHIVTPASDPTAQVPTMPGLSNTLLNWRNTYHWNKHQFALGVTTSGGVVQSEDFSKAALTHWYHMATAGAETLDVSREASSVKQPLEFRKWYSYPYDYASTWSGMLDHPTYVARVLEDGTTQLSQATYQHVPGYDLMETPWPLTVTDPLNRQTQYTYAANYIDLLTVQQQTSGSGFSTIGTFGSYNTQHEPQTYTGADGQTWNYTYNTVGQLKTITDPNSGVTTYNYDTAGRLSTVVNANSATVLTLTYDSADRVQTRTDSEGYTLTYAYDNLDRVTSITYPDSTTDLYDYTFQSGTYAGTASLELRKHTDRLGRVTTYAYDADRRLTSVTEPTSGTSTRTTSYDYYEDGTLKDITDANGNVTHWDIDIESRPIDKIYAYGTSAATTETYTWEVSQSRLHSITDALGQVKTFSYAADNRVTGITYTSTVNPTPNVTFAWDTYFPRLTSMTDGTGTTNYSYTAIGSDGGLKLSSNAGPYGNDTTGLTYDALGRLAGRTIAGGNETFTYDAISRLQNHTAPLVNYTYFYLGQTGQQTYRYTTAGLSTVATAWSYDTNTNDRRLIGIGNSWVSRSYTLSYLNGSTQNPYDVMSVTDTVPPSGHPWATQTHGYTYDNIDRLLSESVTTPGASTFAYDNLDNATTYDTPATGSLSPTYNANNQTATWGSLTYSYDADGNLLSGDGVKTYKWDAENRLIEIDYVGTSNTSTFTYNGIGERISNTDTIGGVSTTTRYLWCGSRICQTRDGSDNVIRRDVEEGEYSIPGAAFQAYLIDQLGSVRDTKDVVTGNFTQAFDYTPYGAVARQFGYHYTDYQYAGLFAHMASGLYFSATRPYDPATGRWLTRDPIREGGGINLYAYVGANTTNYTDTLGLAGATTHYLPRCNKSDSCPDLTNKMNRLNDSLKERRSEMDPFSTTGQSWEDYNGHAIQMRQQATQMDNCQQIHNDNQCPGPPPPVYNPFPLPPWKPLPYQSTPILPAPPSPRTVGTGMTIIIIIESMCVLAF